MSKLKQETVYFMFMAAIIVGSILITGLIWAQVMLRVEGREGGRQGKVDGQKSSGSNVAKNSKGAGRNVKRPRLALESVYIPDEVPLVGFKND